VWLRRSMKQQLAQGQAPAGCLNCAEQSVALAPQDRAVGSARR
jgi:hypothetical protein